MLHCLREVPATLEAHPALLMSLVIAAASDERRYQEIGQNTGTPTLFATADYVFLLPLGGMALCALLALDGSRK